MKIDFVKTLEASSPYTPGRIYFEESTSLIKVATANNQYRVFGGVRSADYDESTQTLTIQNGNGDEVYLAMSEYVKQDSIIYNGNAKIFYGTCSSGGSDTTKIVECEVFTSSELVKGALIFVTFDATNSAAAADILLNVNNTGAKHITKLYNATANPNLNAAGELKANKTYLFGYDGTNWVCLTLDYNTTYSSMTEAEATAGTSTSNRVITPARLKTAITYWMTQNQADWDSSDNTSPKYIANKPDIPTDASVAAWGYLKANDVSTKVDKTDAVSSLSLAMNSSTYTITLSGTMADGSTFTVGNPVDLPLETMVVDGSYNSSTKKVVLGLKNGSSVEFSVADLVAGLQSEITSSNKLSADLIQDGTTNKVVTATDKNNWNSLVSNVQSDWNATTGLAAILNKPDLSLYMTIEDYEEDEEVVAASLNDLNDRILALTSQIPTDASVSGWGYIKTIVDASIAALGYTKNTGTLTGVNFNGVDASVTNGVASITADLDSTYIIHVTIEGDPIQDGSIHDASTDHYYSDIADAYSNGKVLIVDFNGILLPHIYINESTNEVQFGTTVNQLSILVDIRNNYASYMANRGLTSETDPVFSASAAAGISSTDITSWNNKVSNVQADWNATTGLSAILNKPTIPSTLDQIADGSTRTLSNFILGSRSDSQVSYNDIAQVNALYDLPNGKLYALPNSDITGDSPELVDFILATTSDIPTDASVAGWGYIKSYTETDPTVPAWAKAANKPTYTASEVGALPDTTTIPTQTTDASVAAWGYIKTIADASIAALGYTKNTGTLTGVNFNGVDASVTNGVASIAPYHIDLNGSYLYITLNGSCVLQIVTTYHGQYENGSVTHLINVDVNSDNISVHPICLGDMSCFELSPFMYQSGEFFPVGIRDRRSSGGDLILTIKIYNDGEDPNATKSADITVLGGTPPLSYTMSNTIIQEHDYRWVILSSSIADIGYYNNILYTYSNDGSRTQLFTASSIVSDGGGLTGLRFNGVDASVTNGVASISATIPPDNVFIIPVTKSGTTYSTTVTKSEARAAIDANKLLFVRMAHNRMVMPLRSYDTEDYGDYYFYAVSQYYIYTINLVASGSDGPLSCYYSESALPSAITESTVSGWGFTKNTGTLTGVKFNNTNATINGTVAEITATIPTVNNATLSILKNGTSIGTFTANSSTDTSINIQFNELPIPSTVGPMLVSRYNAQSQVTEWAESTNIFDISNTIHLGNGIPLTAHGSYGDTILATGGILKTNFSDWSWINIQYQENNTTVIKNLQDYLDDSIIFPTASGRIAESYYNSTTQRYEWKASDYYSITSPHVILAQPSGGFSVLKNTTDNPRTAYSLTSSGIVAVNDEGWSWIKYRYNSVITTLQDALDGKQNTLVGSGTGQNIKTVNNNSLVGSGNVSVGTLTGVKFNNVSATINGTVAEITATIPSEVTESTVSSWGFTKNTGTLTSHATHKLTATNNNATSTSGTITFVESLTGTNTATSGDLTITATRKSVTIPSAPGTLKTNNTTAQTASASESLSGTINLHKVAKTGTYSDLIGTPTIPAAANNATITIQKGGTNVDSFTVNASTNKTINIPNELPTVTSTDNGKILEVVNGAWAAASPITVYSGSNAPNNSTGNNGDIYIQS